MITVWGRATSANVQKVMWTVAELGMPYERIDAGGVHGGLDTDAFRAVNPHGKVPAARFADGVTMFESNAIMRRLALTDPERRLWPAEGQASADADMWAEWAHIEFAFHLTAVFKAVVRTRPADRDPSLIARHLASANQALSVAEERLMSAPFIAADQLTIADISLGYFLYRYFTMEIEQANLPSVFAYYQRLTERPAFAQHVMVDYQGLRPAE